MIILSNRIDLRHSSAAGTVVQLADADLYLPAIIVDAGSALPDTRLAVEANGAETSGVSTGGD